MNDLIKDQPLGSDATASVGEEDRTAGHLIVMARRTAGGYQRLAQWRMEPGVEPTLVDGTEENVRAARAFVGRLCKHLRGEGAAV